MKADITPVRVDIECPYCDHQMAVECTDVSDYEALETCIYCATTFVVLYEISIVARASVIDGRKAKSDERIGKRPHAIK